MDDEQFLNESTADFNKEIRQINQELIQDGILDPKSGEVTTTPRSKQTIESQESKVKMPQFKLDLSKCIEQDIGEVHDIQVQLTSKEDYSERTPKKEEMLKSPK